MKKIKGKNQCNQKLLDLDSPLIKARGFDTIIENKVPQNRETRERMRKSRLKKLNNSLY